MKNSINKHYICWLQRYYSTTKDHTAPILIEKITAIEELIKLFSNHIKPEIAPYGSINFYTQLSTWKSDLEKIMTDQKHVLADLDRLIVTPKNKKLIMLLKEILSEHPLLLHRQMSRLLQALCSNPLPDLIHYIVNLPIAPVPSNPRPRSFAAQVPKSPQHAACLTLLNNLSSSMDKKHRLWDCANRLLQTSLQMYRELDFVEVSLDLERTAGVRQDPSKCKIRCMLM